MEKADLTFARRFIDSFAQNLTEKQIEKSLKKIFKGRYYLWQIPIENGCVLLGDEARLEFEKAEKDRALEYVFDGPLSDAFPTPLSEDHMTYSAIDKSGLREFYVFDSDFRWCYVITHEGDSCGPFFFKSKTF